MGAGWFKGSQTQALKLCTYRVLNLLVSYLTAPIFPRRLWTRGTMFGGLPCL